MSRFGNTKREGPRESWDELNRRHRSERESEIAAIRIPPAMEDRLVQASTRLLDAISIDNPAEAYRNGRELGLRNHELIDFIRRLDRAQQYEITKKLINPITFEVLGAGSFREADSHRRSAEETAAHYGVSPDELEGSRIDIARRLHSERRARGGCGSSSAPEAEGFRRWNLAQSRGESSQRAILRDFLSIAPGTSYASYIGHKGADSLLHGIGKFDPTQRDTAYAASRRRGDEITAHYRAEEQERKRESALGSIRLAIAQAEADPTSVSRQVHHQIYLARSGSSGASPLYREALRQKGLLDLPLPSPTSMVRIDPAELRLMLASVERGDGFLVSDPESFFRAAYYHGVARGECREADAGKGSVLGAHARAGLLHLIEKYRASGNEKALTAIERLVPDGSPLLPPEERSTAFAPRPRGTGRGAGESLASAPEKAQKWSESLERFIARHPELSRSDALQAAARVLVKKFGLESIEEMHSLVAREAGHPELESVIRTAVRTERSLA